MVLELRHQARGQHERSPSCGRLWRSEQLLAVSGLLALEPNIDGAVKKVNVLSGECEHLASAQASEGCEQDKGAVLRLYGPGERMHLRQRRQGTLVGRFDSGALDRARIDDDKTVLHGGGEDGTQQAITLRDRRTARPIQDQL